MAGCWGKAAGIPSTALFVSPKYKVLDDYTIAHEAGHCLGLFHTHHGTGENEGIPEYVDGSNSHDAGDLVVDTPADPNKWIGKVYNSSLGLRDAHGDYYSPDPYNLMSYAHNDYQRITPNQIERIHSFLNGSVTVSDMAARLISPTAEELGGQYIGGLHFSERTKTLTFPVAAEDEQVTWTITHRCSSGNATSQAPSRVTTKTGKSITLERGGNADYFEVYATTTTPYGMERKSAVWKATAGVPSAAVGTLSWTGGDGTSGSFPGYSPTLVLRNYDTSLTLSYTDLANPLTRRGVSYKLYTSTGGVYDSMYGDFCISEMDISRGYVEVQAIDN